MAVNGYAAAQDVVDLKTSTAELAVAMGERVNTNEISIGAASTAISELLSSLEETDNRVATKASQESLEATNEEVATVSSAAAAANSNANGRVSKALNGSDFADVATVRTNIGAASSAALLAATGSTIVSYQADAIAAIVRTIAAKLADFKTFEDFGAVGDYDSGTEEGTDNTTVMQEAIDWAYGGGTAAARALLMTSNNFLTGPLTLYPTTCIIGTGSHTSGIWCKTGSAGHFIADNGQAAKINLLGVTVYGRNNATVTSGINLGNGPGPNAQHGTEGCIRDVIVRDFINADGININGNVGRYQNITGQSCRRNIRIVGNANKLVCVESMQAGQGTTGAISGGPADIIGLEISGCFVIQAEIEATVSGGLPLKMNGDCHVHQYVISTANGTTFSHLIEVNTSTYNQWSLTSGDTPVTGSATITNGCIKVGSLYQGGTSFSAFAGKDIVSALNIQSGALRLKDALYQALTVQIYNDGGVIKHRIGSLADASTAGSYCTKISGASTSLTGSPTGAAAFSAGLSILGSGGQIALNTANPQAEATQTAVATLTYNTTGTPLEVAVLVYDAVVDGVSAKRLVIEYRPANATSSTPYNVTSMPVGSFISVGITGFII